MEIKDLESLIQITREIEKQGYAVRSVESEEQCRGRPTLDIRLSISRKRPLPEDGKPPEYVNYNPLK